MYRDRGISRISTTSTSEITIFLLLRMCILVGKMWIDNLLVVQNVVKNIVIFVAIN